MSKAGKRLIEAMGEAVAIAQGAQPAARIHINGHSYMPVEEHERALIEAKAEGMEEAVQIVEYRKTLYHEAAMGFPRLALSEAVSSIRSRIPRGE